MDAQPLAWTPDHVARFWDYWSQRPEAHGNYFAKQVGRGVCRFLEHIGPLDDQYILDFGAGPGYLVDQLLQCGAQVAAVEYSPACVPELNDRFGRDRLWRGAKLFDGNRLPWEDNTFDLVCCLETIEHLLPEHLNSVLCELQRVVRVGGSVILTTPNAEDLNAQMVFCPHCCHEFHRWQHLRRWTPQTLTKRLRNLGYEVRFCRGLSFHDFQPAAWRIREIASWRACRRAFVRLWDRARDAWERPEFPNSHQLSRRLRSTAQQHLVAVAQKVTAEASEPNQRAA